VGTSISQIITVTTPALGVAPTPATGLTVSNLSTTTLTLSWAAPTGGTTPFAYQPQISLGGGPPVWTNIGGSISATTVPVTGLTPNTAYQFEVITSNATGNSFTTAVAATTLAIGPSAPTGLAVSGTPTQTTVSLQWNAPTTGTTPITYQVLSRTPSGSGAFAAIGTTTTGLTTTISGLVAATGYDFEVIASNSAGSSLPSVVLTGVQTAGSIANQPGPATGLVASAITSTTLTFSWTAPSTGTGPFTYQPLFALAGTSPVWTNIGNTSNTTVPVTGLAPNTAYQFEIITLNAVGSSTSSTISATTLAVAPGAPTALAVTGTSTQTAIALQWAAPAVGTAPFTYQVLSRTPTGSGAFTAAAATTVGLTQTISGLLPSTGYDFEVTAANLAGTGPPSAILLNAQTASGSLGNAPGPATGLTLSAVATTSLTLSWIAPSSGTLPFSYQPQISLAGTPNWSNIGGSITATTVASTGLIPNTAYQFQVLTTNSVGSSTSATASATTLSVLPAAPPGFTAGAVTQTTVALSWTAPATGTTPFTYQVLSRTPSGSGVFSAAAATTLGTTQTITGLTASTGYDFEVTAANLAGTGPVSTIVSITTTAIAGVAPSAPTNLAGGAITQATIPISWSAPAVGTAPLSYVVLYRPTPGITPPPGSRIVAPLTGTVTAGSWVTNQSITVAAMPNGFMRYNYLLPQGYSTNFIYPILFYGHENDEGMNGSTYPADGANLVNQTVINGTFNTVAFRTNYPCIVVVPECDQTLDLSGANGNANFGGYADTPNSGGNEQAINALLAYFKTTFSVDPTRCYCTGDSLGAIGALAWIVDNNRVNGVNKLWTAAWGNSDQLYRPGGVANSVVFANMANVPYIAVSTPNDNNQAIYDQAGWTFYTGNTNYPTPAQYAASGVAAMKAGTHSFWYMLDPTGVPWDTYRQLNADGGQATALYNLLFSFII
jgi:hypothetical protein